MRILSGFGTFVSGLFLLVTPTGAHEEDNMTPTRMIELIQQVDPQARVRGHNRVEFSHGNSQTPVSLIYDVHADRMRLISPVIQVSELSAGQLEQAMEANFHTSLDVRYATSEGMVWAAYLHPLASLQDAQFRDAISQVASARNTFGSSYSAGSWSFVGHASTTSSSSSMRAHHHQQGASASSRASSSSTTATTEASTSEMERELDREGGK